MFGRIFTLLSFAIIPLASPLPALAESVIVRSIAVTHVQPGKLKPGAVIESVVERSVYSADREVLPAGARLRVEISSVSRGKIAAPAWWVQAARLATGAPRPSPSYDLALARPVAITSGSAKPVEGRAELVNVLDAARISSRSNGRPLPQSILVLRFPDGIPCSENAARTRPVPPAAGGSVSAHVMLLGTVRASKSRAGDPVEAQLTEPIAIREGLVLPAGTLLSGQLTAAHGPRRLFRPAKMRLAFNRMSMPDGSLRPVATVLNSAGVQKGAGGSLDSEGGISGGRAGKLRMAIDIGVAYVSGKIVDDLLEEGLKMGWGAGISGSAATAARYVGLGTGALFLILQRGRDVSLPQYSELELTFTRPLDDSPAPR